MQLLAASLRFNKRGFSLGKPKARVYTIRLKSVNAHFTSCFSELKDTPPLSPASSLGDGVHLSSVSCTPMDVLKGISVMRQDVASGPDGISSRMLRGCAGSICSFLSSLFNVSLSSGMVPVEWKLSNITPVFKNGDSSVASNYRPISLLSLPSKLLERLIHVRLMSNMIFSLIGSLVFVLAAPL